MGQPEKISADAPGTGFLNPAGPSGIDRLRDKAKALKGPRGKYRCRKCHDLPCTCPDPKSSTPAAPSLPAPSVSGEPLPAPKPLFTEQRTKRLLDALFGIPALFTNCKIWALTEDEAEELGKPASDVLNEFVTVDPKWASVAVLCVSGLSIVSRKAVMYNGWRRAMMVQALKERQATAPPKSPDEPANSDDDTGPAKPGPSATIEMFQ